jgi:hypothetical protein
MCVSIYGVWIGERFIGHLYKRLGTTINYSTTANLHNSQITTAPGKPFQPAVSSPAVPWQRSYLMSFQIAFSVSR